MTETKFYEPARLSTPTKPLFSLKPLDTTTKYLTVEITVNKPPSWVKHVLKHSPGYPASTFGLFFHVTLTPNRPTVSYNGNRMSILMYTLYTHVCPVYPCIPCVPTYTHTYLVYPVYPCIPWCQMICFAYKMIRSSFNTSFRRCRSHWKTITKRRMSS